MKAETNQSRPAQFRPLKRGDVIPKILEVSDETANANWNKHMPVPLRLREKVMLDSDQTNVGSDRCIRIKRIATDNRIEICMIHNFCKPTAKK